jgi:4-diphosphocytidyl-2-C-methyl-D-erythritol kinase
VSVVATAPGKINLLFRVGGTRDDGYHEVLSIYQAVSIREQVRVRNSSSARLLVSGSIIREQLDRVPRDGSNLVVRAAQVLADAYPAPERDAQGLEFEIVKEIPLLGGMAGGSADAAAALVAVAKLWEIDVPRSELQLLATRLGSDVPFSLLGGSALGQGRGEKLTELESSPLHFVLVFSTDGLSTPEVFRTLDARRATWDAAQLNSRTTYTADEIRIQIYDDVAVVAFRMRGVDVSPSEPMTTFYLNSGTFVKRDGHWRVVNWQATRIP